MRGAPFAFSLRQLQYAVAVADTLGFRKAAGHCHVSQPSLSAQLAQLEGVLGVRLFERDRRSVRLTAAGRALVERARHLLLEAEQLEQLGRHVSDPHAGTLRVGIIPTVSPWLLPRVSPALRRAWPRLALAWREGHTEALVEALARGELDALVVARTPELGTLELAPLADDAFFLAVGRGHRLAGTARPVDPGELAGEEVLLLDEGHCLRDQVLALCHRARAREVEFRGTSLVTLVQMAAAGLGVTVVPALAVDGGLTGAGLWLRRFTAPAPSRALVLAFSRRSSLRATLLELAATLRAAWPHGASAPQVGARPPAGRRRGGVPATSPRGTTAR